MTRRHTIGRIGRIGRIGGIGGLVLAGALALTGCTGGTDDDPATTPSPGNTATRWRAGEFTADRPLCTAVGPKTLERLSLESSPGSDPANCSWSGTDTGPESELERSLSVRSHRYEPSPVRPDHTATEEARHEFLRPHGWRYGEGTPLRGYGDEAKISRSVWPDNHFHLVKIAFRVRNLVVEVDARVAADPELTTADRVTDLGTQETGAVAAAQDVLRALGTPARPAQKPAPYAKGEVEKVPGVCGHVPDPGGLVPGGSKHDLTPKGATRTGGCQYVQDDDTPDTLTVTAETVAPGTDGTGATRLAEAATRDWPGGPHVHRVKLGDQAFGRRYSSSSLRSADVWVRRGNLLVFVGYERWSGGQSAAGLEDDAVSVARALLDAYS